MRRMVCVVAMGKEGAREREKREHVATGNLSTPCDVHKFTLSTPCKVHQFTTLDPIA